MIRAVLVAAVALLLALFASPARAGLPTAINDLQRCQTFAQQIQSGNYPADTCSPDTLSTVSRSAGVSGGGVPERRRRKKRATHLSPSRKKASKKKQIKRCTAQGVQFGVVSQADADALIANLELYCRLQQG